MTDTRTIRSHDELISYIPHLMGFHPESSLVCVSVGGGPHSRIDLPHSPDEMEQLLQQLSDVYLHRHPVPRVALVAYGENGLDCLEALTSLGATLNYGGGGPEIGPMLWVKGDQWYDVLNDSRGTVDPVVRDRVDAEFALMGRAIPTGRRKDLAVAMQGDPSGVAEHLVAAEARVLDMDTSANVAEVRWLGSCLDGFLETGKYLEDDDAARVLAIIHAHILAATPEPNAWLFSGTVPGRHADAGRLRTVLNNRLGLPTRHARNTATSALALDLPPPVLAGVLGIEIGTAIRWTKLVKRDWGDYLAQRAQAGA